MATEAAWGALGQQGLDVWRIVGLVGPLLFAALLVFFLVRALVRHSRYRAVDTLGDEDRSAVREAVVEAERRTVGEILPVVVERSDPHPGAE